MNYDANVFCEIIESIQGIRFVRQEEMDGIIIRFYEGTRGRVQIDYDDDNFTDSTGKGYLQQLGLEHLIPSMYPVQSPIESIVTPIIQEKVGNGNDCNTCNGVGLMQEGNTQMTCIECNGTGTVIARA